jgi:ABC-2 type transport system permease protein
VFLHSITGKSLLEQRRALIGWSLGIAAMVLLTVSVYPSIRDSPGYRETIEELPESVRAFIGGAGLDPTSPAGYLSQRLFAAVAPALLIIYAVAAGARSVAGEEEAGTLDLLLSQPVTRARAVLEKAAALLAGTVLLGAVRWVVLLATAAGVGMHLGAGTLAAEVLMTVLLALVFGALALGVGAATGRRGIAIGVGGGVAVAAYLVDSLATLVSALEPLRAVSPFHLAYGDTPLLNGMPWLSALLLVAVSAAVVQAGLLAFDRRDVAV